MQQPLLRQTPDVTVYTFEGQSFFMCGRYKSMLYADPKKRDKAIAEKFKGGKVLAGGEQNPVALGGK